MERNALYRRGYAAALRPAARARAVATLGVACMLAWTVAGSTAWAGENYAAAALDADAPPVRTAGPPAAACPGRSPMPCAVLEHDGRLRTYRLHVPARVAARPALLVVLHGGGGNGAIAAATNDRGFNALADAAGVLVAYPDGVDRHWNDGRDDLPARTVREGVDDVGFLVALVEWLVRRHRVDRERVYVVGMSNGAMLSLRLACAASGTFRGFFAVAGNLAARLLHDCAPPAAARVALVFGTDDPLVPWSGGEVRALGRARGVVASTRDTYATFLAAARCAGERTAPSVDRSPDDATVLVVHRGYDCRAGADVRLYELRGGGHVWPGGTRRERPLLTGRATRELDATAEAWAFLGLDSAVR